MVKTKRRLISNKTQKALVLDRKQGCQAPMAEM